MILCLCGEMICFVVFAIFLAVSGIILGVSVARITGC